MRQDWCAALFPGQGSQVPGLAADLCAQFPEARRTYDEASEVLGFDLGAACDGVGGRADDTLVVQPGVVTHSVACWRIARAEYGFDPGLLAGHSVGEIAALVCAEAIGFASAVALLRQRADAMAACPPGAMMVVFGLPGQDIARHCDAVSRPGRPVSIGLRNAPDQVVLTGDPDALSEVAVRCEEAGGVIHRLKVGVAAHGALMTAAVEPFSSCLESAGLNDPRRPVISGATGLPYLTAQEAVASLVAQLTGPVDWVAVTSTLAASGARAGVELGPKAVLTKLLEQARPEMHAIAAGTYDGLRQLGGLLGLWSAGHDPGRTVPREGAARYVAALLRLLAGTPARADLASEVFQDQVQRPYAVLGDRRAALGAGPVQVPAAVLGEATSLAASVLAAKGFTTAEVRGWLASCAAAAALN